MWPDESIRSDLAGADLSEQEIRRVRWSDVELFSQRPGTDIVPMDGSAALTKLIVTAHQADVDVLAAGVFLENLVTPHDTTKGVPLFEGIVGQFGDHKQVLVLQALATGTGPVLVQILDEVIVTIEYLSVLVGAHRLGGAMATLQPNPRLETGVELVDVDPDLAIRVHGKITVDEGNVRGFETIACIGLAEGLPQRVQSHAQIVPGRFDCILWPQPFGEDVAWHRMSLRDKNLQQRSGFSPPPIFDGLAVPEDLETAEASDLKPGFRF
jgi:hypothetical protein